MERPWHPRFAVGAKAGYPLVRSTEWRPESSADCSRRVGEIPNQRYKRVTPLCTTISWLEVEQVGLAPRERQRHICLLPGPGPGPGPGVASPFRGSKLDAETQPIPGKPQGARRL